MFNTRFDKHERVYANAGDPVHIEYALQISESGVEELVPVGSTFIPDEINSHANSVDIHTILARFSNGETEVLNTRAAMYFDATSMPNNLADMYRTVANGEIYFNKLPLETRAKFNHSFTEFVSSIGTESFYDAFKPAEHVVKEVSADES